MNQPDNSIVLTLHDDDRSLPIDSEIDPYGKLEEQPDNDSNKTYNNNVTDAKLNGVDPAVSNTEKVMEKEVESLFKGFLSIRKFMAAAVKTSGSHDSTPMQYTRRGISKSKTTKFPLSLLSIFSAEARKYRTSVSPFLLYWHPLWWQTDAWQHCKCERLAIHLPCHDGICLELQTHC